MMMFRWILASSVGLIHCGLLLVSVPVNSFSPPYHQQQRTISCSNSRTRLYLDAIRLNKVFKATHSRRQADKLIIEGRVTVNDHPTQGCMVLPFKDEVKLDGKLVTGWEAFNGIVHEDDRINEDKNENEDSHQIIQSTTSFEYIKYWKPRGVICTTDRRIDHNIIDEIINVDGYRPKHRVYPVGRLDKDSSGLILLTSDGRLPQACLRGEFKQPKVYLVRVDKIFHNGDVERLRSGIVITTVAQRDRQKPKPLTAKTKPCEVDQLGPRTCQIVLTEGRNRQIRKMMAALGYEVINLKRVGFGGVTVDDLKEEGSWKRLNDKEMNWVTQIIQSNHIQSNQEREEKELFDTF